MARALSVQVITSLAQLDLLQGWQAVYEQVFPEGPLREPAADWPARFNRWNADPERDFRIFVATDDANQVVAGLNAERYGNSGVVLLTYLAVSHNARRAGIASSLLREAGRYFSRPGPSHATAFLFETEPPDFSTNPHEPTDRQAARLLALSRLGGVRLLLSVPYKPPSLDHGTTDRREILLCEFAHLSPTGGIGALQLQTFLREFYDELGWSEDPPTPTPDPDNPPGADRVAFERIPQIELPRLRLDRCGIVFHLAPKATSSPSEARREKGEENLLGACPGFRTWEHDLLAQTFHAERPIYSRCLHPPPTTVRVRFPSRVRYESEGLPGTMHTATGSEETADFRVLVSRTAFVSDRSRVWHLALRAMPGEELSEYQVVKLISLYEGYEGVGAEGSGEDGDERGVEFRLNPRGESGGSWVDFRGFVEAVLDSVREEVREECAREGIEADLDLEARAGTVQIVSEDAGVARAIAYVREHGRGEDAKASERLSAPERGRLRSLCGIVQGILDFDEIDEHELLDILTPTVPEIDGLLRMHRETLTQITTRDRAFDRCEHAIGISPYLLLPHAVIVHAERLIQFGDQEIDRAEERLLLGGGTEGAISKAREHLNAAAECLIELQSDNPFNYFTERVLYSRAMADHGSAELRSRLVSKLDRLREEAERQDRLVAGKRAGVISGILAAIAVLSLGEVVILNGVSAVSGPTREFIVTLAATLLLMAAAGGFGLWVYRRGRGDEEV